MKLRCAAIDLQLLAVHTECNKVRETATGTTYHRSNEFANIQLPVAVLVARLHETRGTLARGFNRNTTHRNKKRAQFRRVELPVFWICVERIERRLESLFFCARREQTKPKKYLVKNRNSIILDEYSVIQ